MGVYMLHIPAAMREFNSSQLRCFEPIPHANMLTMLTGTFNLIVFHYVYTVRDNLKFSVLPGGIIIP